MPIKIDAQLPARGILEMENIFVMSKERAMSQDIRPLRIVILNLMPTKIETETQLLRMLSNSPIQVDVELMQMATHESKNTSQKHLLQFYKTFDEIKNDRFDGMIVTGAPVEHLPFEQVDYWPELCEIFEWSQHSVWSTFHICWGAQAGLYYHYGIQKHGMGHKLFGVFEHMRLVKYSKLTRGFDDIFYVPHSRYTTVLAEDVAKNPALELLAVSGAAGLYLAASRDGKQVFVTGHPEYDDRTLADEYHRDVGRGLDIAVPENYFKDDNPEQEIQVRWRGHANLLYSNWLNYFVYQETPYDLDKL